MGNALRRLLKVAIHDHGPLTARMLEIGEDGRMLPEVRM